MFLGLPCTSIEGYECLVFNYPKSAIDCHIFLKIKDDDERTVASCINCGEIYESLPEDEKGGSQKPATIPVVNGCYFDSDPTQATHLSGCSPSPFDAVMERFNLAVTKEDTGSNTPSEELNTSTSGIDSPKELNSSISGVDPSEKLNTSTSGIDSPKELNSSICGIDPSEELNKSTSEVDPPQELNSSISEVDAPKELNTSMSGVDGLSMEMEDDENSGSQASTTGTEEAVLDYPVEICAPGNRITNPMFLYKFKTNDDDVNWKCYRFTVMVINQVFRGTCYGCALRCTATGKSRARLGGSLIKSDGRRMFTDPHSVHVPGCVPLDYNDVIQKYPLVTAEVRDNFLEALNLPGTPSNGLKMRRVLALLGSDIVDEESNDSATDGSIDGSESTSSRKRRRCTLSSFSYNEGVLKVSNLYGVGAVKVNQSATKSNTPSSKWVDPSMEMEKDEDIRSETNAAGEEVSAGYPVEMCAHAKRVTNPMLLAKFKNCAGEWKCYRFTVKNAKQYADLLLRASCAGCGAIYRDAWRRRESLGAPLRDITTDGHRLFADPHSIHVPGCVPLDYNDVIEKYPLVTAEFRDNFLATAAVKPPSPTPRKLSASTNENGLDEDHEQTLEKDEGVRNEETNATVADQESIASYPVEICKAALGTNPIFVYKFKNDDGQWKCYRFTLKTKINPSKVDARYSVSCSVCMHIYQEAWKKGSSLGVPVRCISTNGHRLFTDPHSVHVLGCAPLDYGDVIEKYPLATAEVREQFGFLKEATVKSPSPKSKELCASTNGNALDEDHEQPLEKDGGVRDDEPNATDQESAAGYPVEICKPASGNNPMFVYKFKNVASQWKCYRFVMKNKLNPSNVDSLYRVRCVVCANIYQEAYKRRSSFASSVRSIPTNGHRLFIDPHSIHVPGCVPLDYSDVIARYPLATAEVREKFGFLKEVTDGSKDDCESTPACTSSSRKQRRCAESVSSSTEESNLDHDVIVDQSIDGQSAAKSNTPSSKSVDPSGDEPSMEKDEDNRSETNTTGSGKATFYHVEMCAPTNWFGNPMFLSKFRNGTEEWKCYRFNGRALFQKHKSCDLEFRATCSGCGLIYTQERKKGVSLHVHVVKLDGCKLLSDPHANHLPGCVPFDYDDVIKKYPLVSEEVKEMIIRGEAVAAVKLHASNMLKQQVQREELKARRGSYYMNKVAPIKRGARGGSKDDHESPRTPASVASPRKKRRCLLSTPSIADEVAKEKKDDSYLLTALRCDGTNANDDENGSLDVCEAMELDGDAGDTEREGSAGSQSTTLSSSAEVSDTQRSVAIGYALIKAETEEIGDSSLPPSDISFASPTPVPSAPIILDNESSIEPVRRILVAPPTTYKKKFNALVFAQDEVEVTVVEGRLLVVRFEKKTSASDEEQSSLLYKAKLPDHVDIDSLTSKWKNGSLVVRANSKVHNQ